MHCRRAREAISELVDAERLAPRRLAGVEEHLRSCASCRAFEAAAWRLRESSRIELAPAVPDLVAPIMATVERDTGVRPIRRLPRPARVTTPRRPGRLAPVAAAVAVGLLAGSVTVGGPWVHRASGPAVAAAEVSEGIANAATSLTAYHAVFALTEHDPRRDDPVRDLTMSVWFQAPERFRLDVVEHGRPATGPAQDVRLVVTRSAAFTSAPSACPVGRCPRRESVVRNRGPFSAGASVADLVLPLVTLVDAPDVEVLGRGTMLGRSVVRVAVPFERARPLFPFLSIGGSWRPFFAGDRVEVWLDAGDWFPLRYTAFPSPGRARDAWELRFGLPDEHPRTPILDVVAVDVDRTAPGADVFRIPNAATSSDEGSQPVPLDEVGRTTGITPPPTVAGLDLYRAVVPAENVRDASPADAVLSYSRGLTWLKLGHASGDRGERLFGVVGRLAEEVELPDGGVGYYEPATAAHGRRLAIRTETSAFVLETNLSRDRLLEAAASLPVTGLPAPRAWLVRSSSEGVTRRVPLERAVAEAPFPLALPGELPAGYVLASTELVRLPGSIAVNLHIQRQDANFLGEPIRLHQEVGDALPPASSAEQSIVHVGDALGRWTPARHLLEWVDGGIYLSIDAPGSELEPLLAIAASLRPASEVTDTEASAG